MNQTRIPFPGHLEGKQKRGKKKWLRVQKYLSISVTKIQIIRVKHIRQSLGKSNRMKPLEMLLGMHMKSLVRVTIGTGGNLAKG